MLTGHGSYSSTSRISATHHPPLYYEMARFEEKLEQNSRAFQVVEASR